MKLRTSRGAPGPRRTSAQWQWRRTRTSAGPRTAVRSRVLTMLLRLYSAAKRTRARLSRAHARSDTDRDSVHATPATRPPGRAPLSGISISLATLRGSGGDAHIVIDPIVYSSTLGWSRFGFCCIRTLTSTSLHGARCRRTGRRVNLNERILNIIIYVPNNWLFYY